MPVRPLLAFPDSRLRQPAAAVEHFDDGLAALARDVDDTLVSAAALGLTAPHLGVARRVMVTRAEPGAPARVYVNPVLLEASAETLAHEEGSVGMPGIRERVVRPARIRIGWRDVGGVPHEEAADGFAAALLLHEMDQLDGVFWIDRLSRLRRERAIRRFARMGRAAG